MIRCFYSGGGNSRYPSNRRLYGSENCFGRGVEEKSPAPAANRIPSNVNPKILVSDSRAPPVCSYPPYPLTDSELHKCWPEQCSGRMPLLTIDYRRENPYQENFGPFVPAIYHSTCDCHSCSTIL